MSLHQDEDDASDRQGLKYTPSYVREGRCIHCKTIEYMYFGLVILILIAWIASVVLIVVYVEDEALMTTLVGLSAVIAFFWIGAWYLNASEPKTHADVMGVDTRPSSKNKNIYITEDISHTVGFGEEIDDTTHENSEELDVDIEETALY